MKNQFIPIDALENDTIADEVYDDLEEEFDEEAELKVVYPEIKIQQKIIRNIENWDNDYLD